MQIMIRGPEEVKVFLKTQAESIGITKATKTVRKKRRSRKGMDL